MDFYRNRLHGYAQVNECLYYELVNVQMISHMIKLNVIGICAANDSVNGKIMHYVLMGT